MEKEFKHKDGNIKVTEENQVMTLNPLEKEEIITVSRAQPKESFLQEVEEKLNLIYSGSPRVIKDFIKWLEDVI